MQGVPAVAHQSSVDCKKNPEIILHLGLAGAASLILRLQLCMSGSSEGAVSVCLYIADVSV
jgi:hypothetical protein